MSVEAPPRKRAPIADPDAREFLRKADPVLARLIDARPDFRPRAWMDELPQLDAFGTLVFQVAGQQLSVASTRAIISHLRDRFGGHMPSPAELLEADPQVLRDSGFSARKGATLRALPPCMLAVTYLTPESLWEGDSRTAGRTMQGAGAQRGRAACLAAGAR